MNNHQLLAQIERLNGQVGHSVEGLTALAHMVDICDERNAPTPFQLAELIRAVVSCAAQACNGIDRTLAEWREQLGSETPQTH